MKRNRRIVVAPVAWLSLVLFATWTQARLDTPLKTRPGDNPQRVLVQDGSTVHNVGELQMHVGNWGLFGSFPGTRATFADRPSAQWPAGSGVEYLYAAGLWVGAIKGNVAAVTTAVGPREFDPSPDPRDIMYIAAEGSVGGERRPSSLADDDGDGLVDEDWLNGRDDDGDGMIDEDFAAVSKQMMACQYNDTEPSLLTQNVEHNPLGILVRQESYQWEEDRFDDFVGINYWITNAGTDVLEDVYIGFFADCDAGARTTENYWQDDATSILHARGICTDLGVVSFDVAYTYDADGDDGQTLGYFGVMFLGHTTDPTGETAPAQVGIHTYASFAGEGTPFSEGGDPTNDLERYELLRAGTVKRGAAVPRDYRMLVSAGPFKELHPGSTLVFQTAFVVGEGLDGLAKNAANAQLTFDGAWFDIDHDALTGISGRETPVFGPVENVVIDSCRSELATPINWPFREAIWINNDCIKEDLARINCGLTDGDSLKFMTGVDGKETQLFWIVGTAPPPPNMRIHDFAADGVALYWDNFSETIPDVKTLEPDFEGYRVWRADNWTRPPGTNAQSGPPNHLWKLLFEVDVINNFGADTGLSWLGYEPLRHRFSARQLSGFVAATRQHLLEHPESEPPCPQGLTTEECDTVMALARHDLGLRGGRQYYRYIDTQIHRGRPYFYSVTALDHEIDEDGSFKEGKKGDPASNFALIEPRDPSRRDWEFQPGDVYVVPNPATRQSLAGWALGPNNDDPTGIKVEFRSLPADRGTIRVYTLAGDLVQAIDFDGSGGIGSVRWNLVSRNGQDVTSGVYLFAVETERGTFERSIGKFVIIR